MPIIINFTGEPSSGKSTAAGALFAYMKQFGYKVELVSEFAKTLAYQSNDLLLKDQLYVFSNQNQMLSILTNAERTEKLDYIIVDSPLYLSIIYGKMHLENQTKNNLPIKLPDSFFSMVMDYYCQYNNRNIFMQRKHEFAANQGRVHDESTSQCIKQEILSLLKQQDIPYLTFETHDLSDNNFNLGKTLFDFCIENGII